MHTIQLIATILILWSFLSTNLVIYHSTWVSLPKKNDHNKAYILIKGKPIMRMKIQRTWSLWKFVFWTVN